MALERLRGGGRGADETKQGADVLRGPGAYEAFKAVDREQKRLKVRPALRAWERITYNYLLRVVENGALGTEIGLVFTFCVVIIKGRNLVPVAEAIDQERCEFVQQYDADKWEMPDDPKAPFIESIEIHVETRIEASDQMLADIEAAIKGRP